jgi:hypothetical protein
VTCKFWNLFYVTLICDITELWQATVCELYLCAMKNEAHVSVTGPLSLLKLCGEYWTKLICMPATNNLVDKIGNV